MGWMLVALGIVMGTVGTGIWWKVLDAGMEANFYACLKSAYTTNMVMGCDRYMGEPSMPILPVLIGLAIVLVGVIVVAIERSTRMRGKEATC